MIGFSKKQRSKVKIVKCTNCRIVEARVKRSGKVE
jgi:hypothetical protein